MSDKRKFSNMSDLIHDLTCMYCKQEFEAKSLKAKYCSDSCRVSYHRLKTSKPAHDAVRAIFYRFQQLTDEIEAHPELFLEDGRNAIDMILKIFGRQRNYSIQWQCVRSGQLTLDDSKPKKCGYCENRFNTEKAKARKEHYSGDCRYKLRVVYHRNDFGYDLDDYERIVKEIKS